MTLYEKGRGLHLERLNVMKSIPNDPRPETVAAVRIRQLSLEEVVKFASISVRLSSRKWVTLGKGARPAPRKSECYEVHTQQSTARNYGRSPNAVILVGRGCVNF